MLFFDFAAAFPSLAHEFLMLVLEMANLPVGLVTLIKAFYRSVRALGQGMQELFYVLAGVLQGCPL